MKELTELHPTSGRWDKVVDEIVGLENSIFAEYEPLQRCLHDELKKNNSGLLYMEIDGQIAGYVMYSCPSSLPAHVNTLAVKEMYRRQGHGEALMKAAIQKCRSKGINRISLHVDPVRSSAVNLYKKLGFQIETVLKAYYTSDRDAYRMFIEFGNQ